MKKLKITSEAQEVLNQLESQHGALMFLISGGCCDGSSPLCFMQKEFKIGENDVLFGYVSENCPVYVSDILADHLMGAESFTLDVAPGRGGGFSLEAPLNVRFINRGPY